MLNNLVIFIIVEMSVCVWFDEVEKVFECIRDEKRCVEFVR